MRSGVATKASSESSACPGPRWISGGLLLPFPPPVLFLGGGVDLDVAALRGRIFLALVRLVIENCTNRLLASGVVGGSIEQFVGVGGTASRKLVHQVPARRALKEGVDDLDVGDAGELGALLGEAPHIVAQGLVGLLSTPFEVPGLPRAHVCALKVAHEDLD